MKKLFGGIASTILLLTSSTTTVVNSQQLDDATSTLTSNQFINDENRARAIEIGQKVQEQIQSVRGGTDDFYNEIIDALKIVVCELQKDTPGSNGEPAPIQRFIDSESAFAYKDGSGECVKVAEPSFETQREYDLGRCEVLPNCYWRPIFFEDEETPGVVYFMSEREPVYSILESPEAPQDAMTLNDAQQHVAKWAQGLVVFIAPGIIMAVVSLLSLVLFIFCRCCCNRCGGRNPNPEGYGFCAKFLPFFFFFVFTAGIAATAAGALLYNDQITGAVTGVFNVSSSTLEDTTEWIKGARQPLVEIKDTVGDATDGIKSALEGSDFIEDGVFGMTYRLDIFGSNTANVYLPRGCNNNNAGAICVPCEVCTDISTEISTTNDQITNFAADGISDFQNIRSTLTNDLVNIASSIKEMVNSNVARTEGMIASIDRTKLTVEEIRSTWDSQDSARSIGVLGMFSFAIVVIFLAIVGIILKYTPFSFLQIIHLAWIFGFIALVAVFITSSLLMASSIFLSDTCSITRIMSQDWTPVMGENAAKGINACFQNESLLEAFNLTESFEFADALEFPSTDVASMFEFTKLQEFSSKIDGATDDTFDTSALSTFITSLNAATSAGDLASDCKLNDNSYSADNLRAPWAANGDNVGTSVEDYIRDRYSSTGSNAANVAGCDTAFAGRTCQSTDSPCTYEQFVWEIYNNAFTLWKVSRDSEAFVSQMKLNMTDVTDYIDAFKTNVTSLDGTVKTIQTDMTASLISSVNDFKGEMYCTFIAEAFDDFHSYMCIELMPALAMVSLMIFMMGVFLIPLNICIIVLAKRLNVSTAFKDGFNNNV